MFQSQETARSEAQRQVVHLGQGKQSRQQESRVGPVGREVGGGKDSL